MTIAHFLYPHCGCYTLSSYLQWPNIIPQHCRSLCPVLRPTRGKTLCLPPRGLRRKKKHTHYETTRGLSQERKTALDCMSSGGTLSGDRWVREQQALGPDLETDRIWKRQSSWLKARFKGECPLGPLTNNFNMETSLLYQDDIFIVCVCVCVWRNIYFFIYHPFDWCHFY